MGISLSELGYQVNIKNYPDSKVGMYRIYINVKGVDIMVFSTNYRDKSKNTIIANTPKDCFKQIIKNILSLIEM